MKNKKSIKLLFKITIAFLFLLILAFGLSTTILTFKTNNYIEKNVEYAFDQKAKHITEKLENGVSPDFFSTTDVILLSPEENLIPRLDVDTLMLVNGDYHLFRIKEKIISVNGHTYKLILKKSIQDFTSLKSDTLNTLLWVFSALSVIFVLFGLILSNFLFKPFNNILNEMKRYRLGKQFTFKETKSSTTEFQSLEILFKKMLKQVENDYLNLKEYTENMAHEFQTPLAIIRAKTENLIGDDNVMEKHANNIKAIYDETNHLSKLGNTLKLLTKIENNEFNNQNLQNTKAIILDQVDKLHELGKLKSLNFNTNLNGSHQLFIDPFLFEILLKNLIRNAILYSTPESEITIITTKDKFSIANTSTSKTPKSIFNRFSKGKANKNSLGLGLAIVSKICEISLLSINHEHFEENHVFTVTNEKVNEL